MSVIYKYRIKMDLETESMYIELPIGANILSVIVEDPYMTLRDDFLIISWKE